MKRGHQTFQRKLARPINRRQPWLKLVEAASAAGRRASGAAYAPVVGAAAGPGFTGDGLEDLRHLRRGCRPADFPIEGVSAGLVAEAFLKIVDAFALAQTPSERRSRWAQAVLDLSAAVGELLDEQRRAEMEASWQGRLGGDR